MKILPFPLRYLPRNLRAYLRDHSEPLWIDLTDEHRTACREHRGDLTRPSRVLYPAGVRASLVEMEGVACEVGQHV